MRLPNLLRLNFNFIVIFDKFIILDKRMVCVEVDISSKSCTSESICRKSRVTTFMTSSIVSIFQRYPQYWKVFN